MIVRMTLTSKQKRTLKAQGQKMADDAQLGKAGLSEAAIAHLNRLLARQELIKLRFTDLQGGERGALAEQVCTAVNAECVAIVGRTMLLYRAKAEE